jgi:exo-beta-1,3-glucanase (GH17 family)
VIYHIFISGRIQLANVHPWFAGVSIDVAADWTASFFETTDVQAAANLSNNPKMYIAETGWPTVGVPVLYCLKSQIC